MHACMLHLLTEQAMPHQLQSRLVCERRCTPCLSPTNRWYREGGSRTTWTTTKRESTTYPTPNAECQYPMPNMKSSMLNPQCSMAKWSNGQMLKPTNAECTNARCTTAKCSNAQMPNNQSICVVSPTPKKERRTVLAHAY